MFTLTDTRAPNLSIFDYPAPAGAVIGEVFDNALETNPVPMFMLSRELNAARERGPTLPADQAQEEARRAGVTVDIPKTGITQDALGILIQRRKDDIARQTLLARQEGFLAGAGSFGAGLAGALMDPINAAAGFIPVLGGTRYAGLLADAATAGSRAAIRAGVGAAEGLVGAAAVEVPTLALHRELQDDYSLYDSLANVAFGTFASAGIRGVSGAARDAYLGLARARQLDALHAIDPGVWEAARQRAQTVQERAFWTDLEQGFQRGEGLPPEMVAAFEAQRFGPEFAAQMSDYAAERSAYGNLADVAIERMIGRQRDKMLAAGVEPDEALTAAVRAAAEAKRGEPAGGLLSQADIGRIRIGEMALDDARRAILEGRGVIDVPGRPVPQDPGEILLAISGETHARALNTAVAQAVEGRAINVDPVVRQDPVFGSARMGPDEVRREARANMAPEAKVGADKQASDKANASLKEKPMALAPQEGKAPPLPKSPELVAAEAALAADRARVEADVRSGGGEFKFEPGETLKKAEDYEAAWRAAASCVQGRGL